MILDSNTGFAGKENIEDHIYDLRENDEYDILKMLGKIKWINKKQNLKVNVADLSQSRYLTDQEVQQIITGLTNMYKTKPAVVTNPFAHLQDKDK